MAAAEPASVTLEHLPAIRATQAARGDELATIRLGLSAMGQQLAGRLLPSIRAHRSWATSSAASSASSDGWS